MRETANKAIVDVKALATGLDRLIVMTNEIIGIMETSGLTQASLYKRRLELLTNFARIVEEFKPECNHKFAQI